MRTNDRALGQVAAGLGAMAEKRRAAGDPARPRTRRATYGDLRAGDCDESYGAREVCLV